MWPTWHENRPFVVILLVLFLSMIVFFGVKIDNTLRTSKEIGRPQPFEHQITVEGEGRATGKPDIATISLSVDSKGEQVAAAQEKNTETMNTIIKEVKALGIDEKDVQTTNYNVYEDKYWDPETGEDKSNGWVVSQQITIKIRDTSKIADVLTVGGKNNATNIVGPNFTIDDTSNLKAEARKEAIAEATKKAKELAKTLGVRLEKIIGYTEWTTDSNPYSSLGMGGLGGMFDSTKNVMPDIQAGSNEVKLNVSLIYTIAE
jgi:hypothetical protein